MLVLLGYILCILSLSVVTPNFSATIPFTYVWYISYNHLYRFFIYNLIYFWSWPCHQLYSCGLIFSYFCGTEICTTKDFTGRRRRRIRVLQQHTWTCQTFLLICDISIHNLWYMITIISCKVRGSLWSYSVGGGRLTQVLRIIMEFLDISISLSLLNRPLWTILGGPAQTLQLFQTLFIAIFLCCNFSSRWLEIA